MSHSHPKRHLRRGLLLVLAALASAAAAQPSVTDVRLAIVDHARSHFHATDWRPGLSLRSLSYGYYCNIFVADVLREAGGATWDPIPERLGVNPTRDPVAREWADPSFPIKGWTVIFDRSRAGDLTAKQILALREPGDIVSDGRHVGIVSDERKLISASSVTGAVEHNDYSFKLPNQDQFSSAAEYERRAKEQISQYTVRRFQGNQ